MPTFKDFRNRAKERGLPSDRTTWLRYEARGLVFFPKLFDRRIFKDVQEIDKIIDQFLDEAVKQGVKK